LFRNIWLEKIFTKRKRLGRRIELNLFSTLAAAKFLIFYQTKLLIMFNRLLSLFALVLVIAGLNSCSKTEVAEVQGLDQSVLHRIEALGFSSEGAIAIEGGYLVENDIFLTEENLNEVILNMQTLIIADEEQYRTFNLVTGLPRTITVSSSGNVNSNVSSAIDVAIARYNAEGLGLTFQRVASGGNINIKVVNGGSFIASAGFPSGGNPYNQVSFNKQYQNWNNNTLASVFAHEMGHCIGFRHTDYMNRSYSCGTGGNEGQETTGVGAVHIPGTPTGPDAASWMLACIGNGVNRPFNNNDVTALNYLY
jgi:hypothetical protein